MPAETAYAYNSAGMPVAHEHGLSDDCWTCDIGTSCDGLCDECLLHVILDGDLSRLDAWDAEAAHRGLPPIDRDAFRRFYAGYPFGDRP